LARILRDEIASTKAVLAAMDAKAETNNFLIGLAKCSNLEQDAAFSQVRRLVAETFLQLAPNGYTLKPPSWTNTLTPEEMVREMIETSSHELAAIGAITTRATPAVEPGAERRA
jgi:hypothetical protein